VKNSSGKRLAGFSFLFGSFCFLRRSPELGFWDYRLSSRTSINHEICEFLHPFPFELGFVVFVIDSPTFFMELLPQT
jgi:hypothetical protein